MRALSLQICFLFSSFAYPGDPVSSVRQAINYYYSNFPQEKVYIQLDREQYSPGDIIWFKGYLTCFLKPSTISKIVYLELFNNDGQIISQLMLPVEEGSFNGDIVLPDKLKPGDYFLRAYTAWMLNFKNSLFFYKKLTVVDENKKAAPGKTSSVGDFSVQFFPEGGNLVQGLTSLVTFKSLSNNGVPLPVSGKIINSFGETVMSLSSGIDGLGSFVIHCSPSITYTAVISVDGINKKIPLPEALKNGVVLHVETHRSQQADTVFFNISRSKIDKGQYQNLVLCAQMNDQTSVSLVRFDDDVAGDPMDTILNAPSPLLCNFHTGVLHLSVLNQSGELLAQRLVFLHDSTPLLHELSMEGSKPNLNPQEENRITLHVPAEFEGSVSVSVTDADGAIDPGEKGGIGEGMLLSTNIDEYVNSYGRFLKGTAPETSHALDLFMLTQKGTMVDLEKIVKHEFPVIKYFPEQSIVLKGHAYQIMDDKKKELLKNGSCFIILRNTKDSLTRLLNAFTDSSGAFAITGLKFNDTASVFVQTGEKIGNASHENIAIEYEKEIIDSLRQTKFVSVPFLWKNWNSSGIVHLQDSIFMDSLARQNAGVLRTVTVKAKVKSHLDSLLAKYATGIFASPGAWAKTLDFTRDEITKNMDENVLDYLNGKVAGLNYQIDYANHQYIIYWRFSNFIAGLSGTDQLKLNSPSFFLDEQLLNVGNEGYDEAIQLLSNIRMRDVAMVRVFQPGMNPMVPDNGPHGSIAIYLRKGSEDDRPASQLSFSRSIKTGYTRVLHDFDSARNNVMYADYFANKCTTLYWSPLVKVESLTHTATFSFHNNNFSKRFRIVAEGIDTRGMIVRLNKIIE